MGKVKCLIAISLLLIICATSFAEDTPILRCNVANQEWEAQFVLDAAGPGFAKISRAGTNTIHTCRLQVHFIKDGQFDVSPNITVEFLRGACNPDLGAVEKDVLSKFILIIDIRGQNKPEGRVQWLKKNQPDPCIVETLSLFDFSLKSKKWRDGSWGRTTASDPDRIIEHRDLSMGCGPNVASKLSAALKASDIVCYEAVEIARTNGTAGWLVTGGYPGKQTGANESNLFWVTDTDKGPVVQVPLENVKERLRGFFLELEMVDDLDDDGALEALAIGTGGENGYFHHPIVLRLGRDGKWRILFVSEKPVFFGFTHVLPPDVKGRIQLSITSKDADAPWAFRKCPLCADPFTREIFAIDDGGVHSYGKVPIRYPLSVLSDFLLAVFSRSPSAIDYCADGATINGRVIRGKVSLDRALRRLNLSESAGGCQVLGQKTLEKSQTAKQSKGVRATGSLPVSSDAIRFECPVGGKGLRYVAKMVKQGNGYRIQSLDRDGVKKY